MMPNAASTTSGTSEMQCLAEKTNVARENRAWNWHELIAVGSVELGP